EVDDGLAAAGPDLDQLAVHGRSVPPVRKAFGEEFDVPDGYLNTASIGIPSVAVGEAVAVAIAGWRAGAGRAPEFDEPVARARAGTWTPCARPGPAAPGSCSTPHSRSAGSTLTCPGPTPS